MIRFFVSCEEMLDEKIILSDENSNHAKVLRLKDGDKVVICDGQGMESVCVVRTRGQEYIFERGDIIPSKTEPLVKVSVYMALPKADKLEHVIQKATELGAYEIITFPTARCVSRPDEKSLKKKLERWQKIAASAAEQSGRGIIPQIIILPDYKEALKRAARSDISIVFYENEQSYALHQALNENTFSSVSLISGPEGGFEEFEIDLALECGLKVCTLGKRILRCETAPLCATAAVMYHAGEF